MSDYPYSVIGFDYGQASRITRDYVCARCYGHLEIEFGPGQTCYVVCLEHGNIEIVGRVSKVGAEKRGQKAMEEYFEVRNNYPDLFGKKPKRSPDEILMELGY
jgi:hypothetical protein